MSPWTGRETSDITYMDTQGVLTELLISTHYLDRDRWEGRTPKYFIEVKTTTSSCDAPFYMSNAQYQRVSSDPPKSLRSTHVNDHPADEKRDSFRRK